MTILVGVLCQDGVVVGSDSSATFSAGQFKTVEQPAQKVVVVPPDVIIAGTGAVGFAQRFQELMWKIRKDHWKHAGANEVAKLVSKHMIEDLASTHAKVGMFGALVAFPFGNRYHLCEFGTQDFQPEFKRSDYWFVTMGSGQPIADPFFGLLRRTLLRDKQPLLREGLFAATWVLEHAIELNPGGINGPPQIGVLERPGAQYGARLLDGDELAEQGDSVKAIEAYLAEYRGRLAEANASGTPPPEPPKREAPSG